MKIRETDPIHDANTKGTLQTRVIGRVAYFRERRIISSRVYRDFTEREKRKVKMISRGIRESYDSGKFHIFQT